MGAGYWDHGDIEIMDGCGIVRIRIGTDDDDVDGWWHWGYGWLGCGRVMVNKMWMGDNSGNVEASGCLECGSNWVLEMQIDVTTGNVDGLDVKFMSLTWILWWFTSTLSSQWMTAFCEFRLNAEMRHIPNNWFYLHRIQPNWQGICIVLGWMEMSRYQIPDGGGWW